MIELTVLLVLVCVSTNKQEILVKGSAAYDRKVR